MESPSQTRAEAPPPDNPEPTKQETIDHLNKTLPKLRRKTESLLNRYQEAGIKYHLIPFTARTSHHNDPMWINILDEVFSVNTDGNLAECVSLPFGRLVSFIVGSQKALDRRGEHLAFARILADSALHEATRMEEKISVTEGVVADVIAVRNAMDEQDLLPNPAFMLATKVVCFEDWLAALSEAEQVWVAKKS